MPPIARKPQQIYINRDIDFIIENHIANKKSKLLFVHGKGGVGKTTLLKKFLSYDAKEIPTVLINLKDRELNSFVDILLDEDITSVKHCPSFEKIRTILLKEPKLLNAIINSDTDVVESKIEEYDKEWGEYAKIVLDTLKFGAKFLKSGEEKKKKEFLNNPEFVLLSALAEDFEDYGLFMVDTFEKIKANDIKSKINFTDSGELSMRLTEKHYRLKDYIEGLVYLLVGSSTTFIIAGRNSQDELNMEVPLDYTDELSLDNFSFSNIKELFSLYVKRDKKLSMPSDKHIEQIKELTNGNPLIVGLFPKVAREYDSWDELDYTEMERRIKTDEEFGLLFYMTDRVLSHLEKSKEVWKLVIPRVLNAEIEKLLFKDEKILKELIEVGLATKGTGKDSERYYLHDDVHRAIVTYYEREFKNGFSSWHDAKVVAELHRELMGFYEKHTELYGVNSAFEGCYHKMMLREGFEREFEVSREEFASLTLGSIDIDYKLKFKICSSFDTLSNFQISELIKVWLEERNKYGILLSKELYSRLIESSIKGESDKITEDIPFLESLKEELKEDSSLFSMIGIAYGKKGEYDNAIEAYQRAIEINPKNDEAYHNMGITYRKKEEYDNAIKACQKAVEINPKNDKAYYNMGIAYDKKEEYDNAIEAYQKAVEINPKNDDAYIKISRIYIDFLKKIEEGITYAKKAIEINPNREFAYHNIGVGLTALKKYEEAISYYQKAIEINPNYNNSYLNLGHAYLNLGSTYIDSGEYEEGIECIEKCIDLNYKIYAVYYILAIAYNSLKNYKQVIINLIEAIRLNPNQYDNCPDLFELQLTQNQPFDQELEKKYIELFQNEKESFIDYEMLKILQDITHKKEVNLEQWKQKYEGVELGWSFDELEAWIDEVEDSDLKARLQEALEVFKGHG